MPEPIRLIGVPDYGKSLIQEQIESNMIGLFDWGFLEAGAFENHSTPNPSGFYGNEFSRLYPASEDSGSAWRGPRNNWVWESGLYYSPKTPTPISGIYVDNVFWPNTQTGPSGYQINYPKGQITFNTDVSPSSVVRLNYSSKYIKVGSADQFPYFQELMYGTFHTDSGDQTWQGSGIYNVPGTQMIDLPAIFVKCLPRDGERGLELGGGQIVNHNILFHVVTENASDLKQITDAVSNQAWRTIQMFDSNQISYPPLTFAGNIGSGTVCYPDMVDVRPSGTYWKKLRFQKAYTTPYQSEQNIYRATVTLKSEVDLGELT